MFFFLLTRILDATCNVRRLVCRRKSTEYCSSSACLFVCFVCSCSRSFVWRPAACVRACMRCECVRRQISLTVLVCSVCALATETCRSTLRPTKCTICLANTVLLGKFASKTGVAAQSFFFSFSFHFRGNASDTKGTAFVVYEDIYDAKQACTHLSGFNVKGRWV